MNAAGKSGLGFTFDGRDNSFIVFIRLIIPFSLSKTRISYKGKK